MTTTPLPFQRLPGLKTIARKTELKSASIAFLSHWHRRCCLKRKHKKETKPRYGLLMSLEKNQEGKTMRRVMRTGCLGLVLTAIALGVSPGLAQNVEQVKLVFEHAIPNIEGKSMVAVVVTYPPGGKSPAHHHARSAFIYAHVLSGAIRSQVGDEPAKVYQVGEGFYELPGSHHRISENASDRDPASLLAVFVVDSNDNPLTIPDQK